MDGHVEQQDVVHLLAEAAKVRAEEEITMQRRQFAEAAGLNEAADTTDTVDEAAVLDDGVHT
ncbi:hypothetical protein D3C87_1760950 [compost metagenome]